MEQHLRLIYWYINRFLKKNFTPYRFFCIWIRWDSLLSIHTGYCYPWADIISRTSIDICEGISVCRCTNSHHVSLRIDWDIVRLQSLFITEWTFDRLLSSLAADTIWNHVPIAIAGIESKPQRWHLTSCCVILETTEIGRNGKLLRKMDFLVAIVDIKHQEGKIGDCYWMFSRSDN